MQDREKFKLAYLSGPVNAVQVHEKWVTGRELGYFGSSDLSEFYEVCSKLEAEAYVITTLPGERTRHQVESVLIENWPMPSRFSGARYHLANMFWLLGLLPGLFHFRPNVLVVTAAQNYWFLLMVLKWRKVLLVPAITCTLWPKFAPMRMSWRILRRLNRIFFRRCADAAIVMSEDIDIQLRTLLGRRKIPIATFLPTYVRSQFAAFRPANLGARPFRVLFAGRIEANKGVYDLVTVAKRLQEKGSGVFHFDICGVGSELQSLRDRIDELNLTTMVTCHGFCERPKLSALLNESHVVIVPTTTAFEEGFNMVCAEAILCGRPLITSAVCPALTYVKPAAVEVPPDDVDGYYQAIWDLANDAELYERKRNACATVQEQFYDKRNSWGAKLRDVIAESAPHSSKRPGHAM
jgi:glycosyltransferase involved in cell wall biosynthesis